MFYSLNRGQQTSFFYIGTMPIDDISLGEGLREDACTIEA